MFACLLRIYLVKELHEKVWYKCGMTWICGNPCIALCCQIFIKFEILKDLSWKKTLFECDISKRISPREKVKTVREVDPKPRRNRNKVTRLTWAHSLYFGAWSILCILENHDVTSMRIVLSISCHYVMINDCW